MGFADLHIHSLHSPDGTASIESILFFASNFTDLDVIAITDHDSIAGNQNAQDLASKYGIEVIPGCEISTADGHLLALFIEQPVPAGLSLTKTLELVARQNGICIAAHPMAIGVNSLSIAKIRQALVQPEFCQVLVGVEAFNGGLLANKNNDRVARACLSLPLAQCGNSDSHILETIGKGSTEFPGSTVQELRNALVTGVTQVRKNSTELQFGFVTHYLPRLIKCKIGLFDHEWDYDPSVI